MKRKPILISEKTFNYLMMCKDEYLYHHPEMERIPISNEKIIYEMVKIYFKTNSNKWKHIFDERGELR